MHAYSLGKQGQDRPGSLTMVAGPPQGLKVPSKAVKNKKDARLAKVITLIIIIIKLIIIIILKINQNWIFISSCI